MCNSFNVVLTLRCTDLNRKAIKPSTSFITRVDDLLNSVIKTLVLILVYEAQG